MNYVTLLVDNPQRDDMINMMEVDSFDNSYILSHIENSCFTFSEGVKSEWFICIFYETHMWNFIERGASRKGIYWAFLIWIENLAFSISSFFVGEIKNSKKISLVIVPLKKYFKFTCEYLKKGERMILRKICMDIVILNNLKFGVFESFKD